MEPELAREGRVQPWPRPPLGVGASGGTPGYGIPVRWVDLEPPVFAQLGGGALLWLLRSGPPLSRPVPMDHGVGEPPVMVSMFRPG